MSDKVKMRLVVDVEYVPNGVTVSQLRDFLEYIPQMAASNGLLTGASEATVATWDARVHSVLEVPENLSEWVSEAVEEGLITMDAERLVRCALKEPAEMLAEWRERAEAMATFNIENALSDLETLDLLEKKVREAAQHLEPAYLEGLIAEREAGMAQFIWNESRFDLLVGVLPSVVLEDLASSPWISFPASEEATA